MKNILDLLIDDFHECGLPEHMSRPESKAWMGIRQSQRRDRHEAVWQDMVLLSANVGINGERT